MANAAVVPALMAAQVPPASVDLKRATDVPAYSVDDVMGWTAKFWTYPVRPALANLQVAPDVVDLNT